MGLPFTSKASTQMADTIPTPANYKEAITSDYQTEWKAAITEELENMSKNKVFKPVPRSAVPRGRRILQTKWVFKVKANEDGSVERFRARLVCKGFLEVK